MNNLNHTFWIFSTKNPLSIASYVVSGIMPADNLKIKKIIFLNEHDPDKFLLSYKPKFLIISKAFHNNVHNLAMKAKKLNIKIISIFDDWHFENTNNKIIERSELNYKLANLSDFIITKTKSAADIIFKNTNINAKIIPDCLRYKTLKPITDFDYPFNISWFGNYTNHKTIIKGIDEIIKNNHKATLNIITNKIDKIKLLTKNKNNNVSINYIDWSLDLHTIIKNSNIIIIPLFSNNKSKVKSSNRIIDSLNMGRFVIINENEQFKEFDKFCFFGNIGDGLTWIKNNKKEAIKKTIDGQKYVLEKYSLDKICIEWKKILNEFS